MKMHFVLIGTVILMTGFGCKKDKPQDVPVHEKKVVVTTVAGDGSEAFADGPVLSARFNIPEDVVIAADGTIYVTDLFNSRIRKIMAGQVSTFAGSGTQRISNGNGSSGLFIYPNRMTLDNNGNLFTLDGIDSRVRKISATADVSTYAGIENPGFSDGKADAAQFKEGSGGIVADSQGNIYVADTYNNRIRKINLSGEVTTIAGNGIAGFKDGSADAAQFHFPGGIAIDEHGNIFVSDRGNFRIRKIAPDGRVSTFAGSGTQGDANGAGLTAQFNIPLDLVIDREGNLFVTDNHRVRKISPQGVVSALAGSTAGYSDGDGGSAKFHYPIGMGIDVNGDIFVADAANHRIRKISFQ